ncbi:MAG: hypothetical protein KDE14_14780 [Rhodobacteraceae bacterium]|nr:hypothetical protein [Paracoccaceae bacterium]
MARPHTASKRFTFDRSFDDPNRLYLPSEKRKAELAAERAAAEAKAHAAAKANQGASTGKEPAAPAEVKPPEPTFTKAELEAAREEGHIAGHAAALEEAATAREHYIADAMALIGERLGEINEQQQESNGAIAETAMRLLSAVLRKVVPHYAVEHAAENIGEFVKQVLPVVLGEPKLVIRVHNLITNEVEDRVSKSFERAGFQGGFAVVPDYDLQPGDCRIEWVGGGADRSEARIWDEIRDIISANFGDLDFDALDRAADQDRAHRTAEGTTEGASETAPELETNDEADTSILENEQQTESALQTSEA